MNTSTFSYVSLFVLNALAINAQQQQNANNYETCTQRCSSLEKADQSGQNSARCMIGCLISSIDFNSPETNFLPANNKLRPTVSSSVILPSGQSLSDSENEIASTISGSILSSAASSAVSSAISSAASSAVSSVSAAASSAVEKDSDVLSGTRSIKGTSKSSSASKSSKSKGADDSSSNLSYKSSIIVGMAAVLGASYFINTTN